MTYTRCTVVIVGYKTVSVTSVSIIAHNTQSIIIR